MYNPYIKYVDKYFPNAVPVVDAFHVIQWITNSLDVYLRTLLKKYKARDEEIEAKKLAEPGRPVHLPKSNEVYMLQKYRWLILANQASIRYDSEPKIDKHSELLAGRLLMNVTAVQIRLKAVYGSYMSDS